MSDNVFFKGNQTGVTLNFAAAADFQQCLQELEALLAEAAGFFPQGTVVHIACGRFSTEQEAELRTVFGRYAVSLETLPEAEEKPVCLPPEEPKLLQQNSKPAVLTIKRTVRGGEEIRSDGDIEIMGNVNPGAKIIAGGNIVVHGTCRGMVQAGMNGNIEAFIIADNLLPMQIRIAGLVACAPADLQKSDFREKAMIEDGAIVLEVIDEQEDKI